MENASKALIIAASILIAIVLITLGVIIVNKGRSAIGDVNLTDQEVSAFNSKWEGYLGNQLGSNVKSLQNTINNYNSTCNDERYIEFKSGELADKDVNTGKFTTTKPSRSTSPIETGKNYTVKAQYTDGGLICAIYYK